MSLGLHASGNSLAGEFGGPEGNVQQSKNSPGGMNSVYKGFVLAGAQDGFDAHSFKGVDPASQLSEYIIGGVAKRGL